MKLKLACASAVLTFLCYDLAWGGALKNLFTKSKTEVESRDEEAEKGEEAVQASKTSSKPSKQVGTEQAQAKEATEKKEIKGNPVIFRIGNKEIRRDEILADIKALPAQLVQQTPANKLFDIMKRQKLMTYLVIEQAKNAGMDKDKAYIRQIEKLKEPSEYKYTSLYKVKRADIDINKHMHNLNYLKLAYEVLPEDYSSYDLSFKIIVIGNSGNINIYK